MSGWIKLHRELLKKPIFENEKLLKVFIWCLCKATHKPHKQLIGKQFVDLRAGQFPTGRSKAGAELGMPPSTAWDYLKLLEGNNTIDIKSNNKFSIVTIENWGLYQSDNEKSDNKPTANEQQIDSRLTANEQQIDTNKNVKNVKNDKNLNNKPPVVPLKNATNVADTRAKTVTNVNNTRKEKSKGNSENKTKYAEFVTMTNSEHAKLVETYGEKVTAWMIDALDNYKGSSGRKYKSDYRAILSWVIDKAEKKGVLAENANAQTNAGTTQTKPKKYEGHYITIQ